MSGGQNEIADGFAHFARCLRTARACHAATLARLDETLSELAALPSKQPPYLRADAVRLVREIGGEAFDAYLRESRALRGQIEATGAALAELEERLLA